MLKMYRLLSTWLLPRLCPGLPHDNHRTIQIKDASTPERRRVSGGHSLAAAVAGREIAYQPRILNIEHHLTN